MNKEKIILENQGLVVRTATILANLHPMYSVEDLVQVGNLSLWKKLDKYDKSRNIKMSTFITMCIRNDMIKYLNKERKNYEIRPTKKREPESPEDSLFLKDFCDKYDGHTKDVLKLKLIGETNKDIGKKLGISQRAVKVAIDKVKKDI